MFLIVNLEVFQKISSCPLWQTFGYIELAVLEQDGQPVQDVVLRPIQIENVESGYIQLIVIRIAVAVC